MEEKRPRPGGAMLVVNDGKFLLGKRNKKIGEGLWIIPGGGIDWGESSAKAAVRELFEETGLRAEIVRFIGFKEIIAIEHEYHSIVFFYEGKVIGGELVPTTDISEVNWFSIDEIKKLRCAESVEWVLRSSGYWK